jgi:hypothetical protein
MKGREAKKWPEEKSILDRNENMQFKRRRKSFGLSGTKSQVSLLVSRRLFPTEEKDDLIFALVCLS